MRISDIGICGPGATGRGIAQIAADSEGALARRAMGSKTWPLATWWWSGAIVEKLDVKRDLVARLEASLRDDAVIASNTSSL